MKKIELNQQTLYLAFLFQQKKKFQLYFVKLINMSTAEGIIEEEKQQLRKFESGLIERAQTRSLEDNNNPNINADLSESNMISDRKTLDDMVDKVVGPGGSRRQLIKVTNEKPVQQDEQRLAKVITLRPYGVREQAFNRKAANIADFLTQKQFKEEIKRRQHFQGVPAQASVVNLLSQAALNTAEGSCGNQPQNALPRSLHRSRNASQLGQYRTQQEQLEVYEYSDAKQFEGQRHKEQASEAQYSTLMLNKVTDQGPKRASQQQPSHFVKFTGITKQQALEKGKYWEMSSGGAGGGSPFASGARARALESLPALAPRHQYGQVQPISESSDQRKTASTLVASTRKHELGQAETLWTGSLAPTRATEYANATDTRGLRLHGSIGRDTGLRIKRDLKIKAQLGQSRSLAGMKTAGQTKGVAFLRTVHSPRAFNQTQTTGLLHRAPGSLEGSTEREDPHGLGKHQTQANKAFSTARMKPRNHASTKNLSYFQKTTSNIKGAAGTARRTRNDLIANQKLAERRRIEQGLGHLTQYWNFCDVRPPNPEQEAENGTNALLNPYQTAGVLGYAQAGQNMGLMSQSQSILTTQYQAGFPKLGSHHRAIPTSDSQLPLEQIPKPRTRKTHASGMQWLDADREQRLRRAELQRVLTKRQKASKQMADDENSKGMAGQILNSAFTFDSNCAVGRSPLSQLDPELAQVGARIITDQLSPSRRSQPREPPGIQIEPTIEEAASAEGNQEGTQQLASLMSSTTKDYQEQSQGGRQVLDNGLYRLSDAEAEVQGVRDWPQYIELEQQRLTAATSRLHLGDSKRMANDSAHLTSTYSKENSAYRNFLHKEKQIVQMHEEGIKRAVDNMQEIIADAEALEGIQPRLTRRSASSSAGDVGYLKKLLKAHKSQRGQAQDPDPTESVVERERRRQEEAQLEMVQQQQRDQIEKGVEKYIEDLRQQIRDGTLPDDPAMLAALDVDAEFGSEEAEELQASAIGDSLFQMPPAQASEELLTPNQDSYMEEYVAPSTHAMSVVDLRQQHKPPINRTSGFIEQLHIRTGQNGGLMGAQQQTDGHSAHSRLAKEQSVGTSDGSQDLSQNEERQRSHEHSQHQRTLVGKQQDPTQPTHRVGSYGSSDSTPTGAAMQKIITAMGRTMANSFKKSPTLRRVAAGSLTRRSDTKGSGHTRRPGKQGTQESPLTRNGGTCGTTGAGAPSTRRPLYDLVRSHREKFERMHTEFERLGEGQGSSLSPLRRGATTTGHQQQNLGIQHRGHTIGPRSGRAQSGEDLQDLGVSQQTGQYPQGQRPVPGGGYPQQDSRAVLSEIPSNASTITEDSESLHAQGQAVQMTTTNALLAREPAKSVPDSDKAKSRQQSRPESRREAAPPTIFGNIDAMTTLKRPTEPVAAKPAHAQPEDITLGVVENAAADNKVQGKHLKIPKSHPTPTKTAALTKFQNAVRSKKFDFIKYVLKEFEKIREGGAGTERALPGAAMSSPGFAAQGSKADDGASQEFTMGSSKLKPAARSVSSSSDNYEEPEDFQEQNNILARLHGLDKKEAAVKQAMQQLISPRGPPMIGRRGSMTSAQIIAHKTMKLNPIEEKKKLQRQLLQNQELRSFVNQHEIMIHQTFEKIFLDLAGPGAAEVLQPLSPEADSHEQVDFTKILRATTKIDQYKVKAKERAMRLKQIANQNKKVINVKELYLKWLLELYNIDNEDNTQADNNEQTGNSPSRTRQDDGNSQQRKDEKINQINMTLRSTFVARAEAKSKEQSDQELRDKELSRAYLFKRLGRMAEESGKLDKLRKQLEEDMRNRQKNQDAPVNESESEDESEQPKIPGSQSPARKTALSPNPKAPKGNQPWSKRRPGAPLGATVTEGPQGSKGLSTLTLALQSKFSPSRTHNNNSAQQLPTPWQTTLTVPARPKLTANPIEATSIQSGNQKNIQQLALHYGKWYLEPEDFNQSMAEHKMKLLKTSVIEQEVQAEAKAQEKAQFCIKQSKSYLELANTPTLQKNFMLT